MEILNDGRVILDPTTDPKATSALFAYNRLNPDVSEKDLENTKLYKHLTKNGAKGDFHNLTGVRDGYSIFTLNGDGQPHYNLNVVEWLQTMAIIMYNKPEKKEEVDN